MDNLVAFNPFILFNICADDVILLKNLLKENIKFNFISLFNICIKSKKLDMYKDITESKKLKLVVKIMRSKIKLILTQHSFF